MDKFANIIFCSVLFVNGVILKCMFNLVPYTDMEIGNKKFTQNKHFFYGEQSGSRPGDVALIIVSPHLGAWAVTNMAAASEA